MPAPPGERLATLETKEQRTRADLERHERLLQGVDGSQGLVGDVRDHVASQKVMNQAFGDAVSAHGTLLVGDKGDGGLVAEVARLKLLVAGLATLAAILLEEAIRHALQ